MRSSSAAAELRITSRFPRRRWRGLPFGNADAFGNRLERYAQSKSTSLEQIDPMGVIIRPAVLRDAVVLARLNAIVHDLHINHEPIYFKRTDPDELDAWFAEFLSRPGARAWMAIQGTSAIGYVTAEIQDYKGNPFRPPHRWLEIDQIAIVPEYRGRGIASSLVQEVLSSAQCEGLEELQLSTWEFNSEAREAFGRLGFRPTQVRYARTR